MSVALESLAHKAICVWRERPVLAPTYETSDVDIPAAVDEFLRCVRYRFPLVKLDDRNGFCHEEGSCRTFYSWVDEFSTLEQFKFNPKAAAVLHLNWQVSQLPKSLLNLDVQKLTPHCSSSKSSTGRASRPTSPAATAATTTTSPRQRGSTACSSISPPW